MTELVLLLAVVNILFLLFNLKKGLHTFKHVRSFKKHAIQIFDDVLNLYVVILIGDSDE